MPRIKDMGIRKILFVLSALTNGEKTPYGIASHRFNRCATAAEYIVFCVAAGLIEPCGEQNKIVIGIPKTVRRYRITEDGKRLLQVSNKILKAFKSR